MGTIHINEAFCPKNHRCPVITACPFGAITQESAFSAPEIDEEKCKKCGLCCKYCRVFSCNAG